VFEGALLVNVHTAKTVREEAIPSKWAHDMVRYKDRAYVADSGGSSIIELDAQTMKTLRQFNIFSFKDHVNTVAIWPNRSNDGVSLWAMLHNFGPSKLVEIDLKTGTIVQTLENVGIKSHSLSLWRGKIITLSSGEGRLLCVDRYRKKQTVVLWEDPNQAFLKGLCVVDDVAYFGIAPKLDRQNRADTKHMAEVAAFDLISETLLWRRKFDSQGHVNVIAAPHISERSTSLALPNWN
jgi:hypothetical protein